ncbi:MAG: penicillin-binding transpeptidase domain-containing protein [Gammaproteobacteria bacterium]|nr:penicillin-binding transpeptidase domain-containing protein [Gammaproteobacteria bacterium]
MVSKPSYDPSPFVTGIDYETYASLRDDRDVPLFNRAVRGQYEPGSTMKPFIALAGLITGVTNPEYTIEDPGWFKLPNNSRLYRDWNWSKDGTGGHGTVDLEKANLPLLQRVLLRTRDKAGYRADSSQPRAVRIWREHGTRPARSS